MSLIRRACWTFVAGLAACGGGTSTAIDANPAIDSSPVAEFRAELIRDEPYVFEQHTFAGQLVRIVHADGSTTYVHFLMADKPGPRPTVVLTQPYAGIEWSGEAVDTRWAGYFANRPNPQPNETQFLHEDVDGPSTNATIKILYESQPLAQAKAQALPHLLNDFSVVLVYGRFYAGGSVRNDIDDMRAGMWFVAEQANIDHARIGVLGGSWGGFEALYASAYGDVRARPLVTVALYPPADFVTMERHFASRTGLAGDYLRPYVNRIHATTGGAPATPTANYNGLTIPELCPTSTTGLPANLLVLHDDNDNLVPVEQSRSLVSKCGAEAVYWPRSEPIDPSVFSHGKILDEPLIQSVATYAYSHLHLWLARPDQANVFYFYNPTSMRTHLELVHAAQQAGKDVSFEAPRLRELCDPRLLLIEDATHAVTGAQMVATAVNAVWGTAFTPANIAAGLASGLPAM